jgi:hypothetical protein
MITPYCSNIFKKFPMSSFLWVETVKFEKVQINIFYLFQSDSVQYFFSNLERIARTVSRHSESLLEIVGGTQILLYRMFVPTYYS